MHQLGLVDVGPVSRNVCAFTASWAHPVDIWSIGVMVSSIKHIL